MRMWMIDPTELCRKHLLGEHSELHKFYPDFVARKNILGRVFPLPQIEPESMYIRHEQLANEIIRRRYNHNSPYVQPDLSYLPDWQREVRVNLEVSKLILSERCLECQT